MRHLLGACFFAGLSYIKIKLTEKNNVHQQLRSGSTVNLMVESGRLIVSPEPKKRYSMQELLAQCDADAPLPVDASGWTDAAPVGKELI